MMGKRMQVNQLWCFSYFIYKGPHSVFIVFWQKAAAQEINVMSLIKLEFPENKDLHFKSNSSINCSLSGRVIKKYVGLYYTIPEIEEIGFQMLI